MEKGSDSGTVGWQSCGTNYKQLSKNRKVKILIVSKSFYPENSPRSFRASELAKEFSRQGHIVTVMTPREAKVHDEFESRYGLSILDMGKPAWKPVSLNHSGVSLMLLRIVRRFLNLFFQYPDIELAGMVARKLKKIE